MAKPTLFLGHIGQVLVQYGHVLVQYEPIPDLHLLKIFETLLRLKLLFLVNRQSLLRPN